MSVTLINFRVVLEGVVVDSFPKQVRATSGPFGRGQGSAVLFRFWSDESRRRLIRGGMRAPCLRGFLLLFLFCCLAVLCRLLPRLRLCLPLLLAVGCAFLVRVTWGLGHCSPLRFPPKARLMWCNHVGSSHTLASVTENLVRAPLSLRPAGRCMVAERLVELAIRGIPFVRRLPLHNRTPVP